jgi:hypothetical protein
MSRMDLAEMGRSLPRPYKHERIAIPKKHAHRIVRSSTILAGRCPAQRLRDGPAELVQCW